MKASEALALPEVKYSIIATQDDCPVRGNAMASDDDAVDKAVEDEILARLDRGDVWAWADVEVCAECEGFKGSAYLGQCSYKDEADFSDPSGYLPQMKDEALEDLKATLKYEAESGLKAAALLARFT